MPAQPATHPTPDQLTAYALGKLSEADLAAIAAHLAGCAACRRAVENAPPDTFLGGVQKARPQDKGTRLPGQPSQPGRPSRLPDQMPAAAPPDLDLPPELADHPKFRVVRELGRGGMGVVYQAEHKRMEKQVALKVISRAVLEHPEALARFHAEVKAAARLDHPNIVRALDADQAGELHLLVMEHVEGLDLARVVERKGPLPIAHACAYARQAALGLQHAHEQGMVHRDIKPQNLMLTPQGKVKILDFGLARVRAEPGQKQQQLTKLDSFMGTPEYVAPEQATDARSADHRADIYSLGATLYCLLAGHPPFQEDTPVKVILAHLEKQPRPIHELRPEVPAGLSAVVAKMLAKDPAQRFQTPAEVAQALAPFVKTPGTAEKLPSPPKGPVSPTQATVLPDDTNRMPTLRGEKASKELSPFEGLEADQAEAPKARPRARDKAARTNRLPWVPVVAAGVLALAVLAGVVLRLRTPEGILDLQIDQADAEVFLDDKKVDIRVPGDAELLRIEWPAGQRKLKVTKGGFQVFSQDVELKAGKAETVRVKLTPVVPVADNEGEKPRDGTPPDRTEDGFAPLFNGKDLAGWQRAPGWSVNSEGHLVGSGPGSDLFTTRGDYQNFHLRAEAMINDGGNSGLFFRCEPGLGKFPKGYEAQIALVPGDKKTGSLYGFVPALYQLHRADEWFTLEVQAEGTHLVIKVNGQTTVDVKDETYRQGHMALQKHHAASVVRFRSIRIKELPSSTPGEANPARVQDPPPPKPANALICNAWIELDPTRAASWPGDPNADKQNYKTIQNGVVTLNTGAMGFDYVRAQDMSIRAQIRYLGGQNIGLSLRDIPGGAGGYYAYCSRDPDGIFAFGLGIHTRAGWKDLQRVRRKNIYNDFFEFKLTAVGDLVTVHVNGEMVIEVRDRIALRVGRPSINAVRARGMFKEIEAKIFDK